MSDNEQQQQPLVPPQGSQGDNPDRTASVPLAAFELAMFVVAFVFGIVCGNAIGTSVVWLIDQIINTDS